MKESAAAAAGGEEAEKRRRSDEAREGGRGEQIEKGKRSVISAVQIELFLEFGLKIWISEGVH